MTTAAHRISRDGWSPDRPFAETKHYKFGADLLHAEFKTFVYGYHPTPLVPAMAAATR